MKSSNRFKNLILIMMVVIFPLLVSKADEKISIPISVEWTYEGQKWENSPHQSNVVIKALNDAPGFSNSSFNSTGNYKIEITEPNFNKAGKYEYLIYQNNEDFTEKGKTVSYDKTKYRLVFFVQNGTNGLTSSVYAYNESDYKENDNNTNKKAEIKFINDDPYKHKDNGEIVGPDDSKNPHKKEDGNKDSTLDPEKNIKDNKGKSYIYLANKNNSNRQSNDRVKTGIESLGIWLVILILSAYLLYKLEVNKRKKPYHS